VTADATLLICDDDADILLAARMLLRPHFRSVITVQQPADIMARLAAERVDVILLDLNYGRGETSGVEGFDWLARVQAADPEVVVVVITAHGGVQLAVEAMKRGASDFVAKPWSNERLLATVMSAAQLRRSRQRAAAAEQKAIVASTGPSQMLLGRAPAMQQVMRLIERAAPTEANVLILGENGTGKELVARELHARSRRADKIFVSVDLGSVAPSLFESELFGHKKGSFTDAKADRFGRFQAADGGTLFLDEIGNLPLNMQPKLLTALEQRQVTLLGSNMPSTIDVRVISATNADALRLRDELHFREDLLFRLNTVEIHLPPLRQRREDIPLLVNHFLDLYSRKYERGPLRVPADVMEALCSYGWPGNIRALRHAVERAVIMASDEALTVSDFSLPASAVPVLAATVVTESDDLNLERAELQMISRALTKHGWNISLAAKELGLTRASLYRRMEKHGL
jgi:DNA-binding NtrC family response regulator